MDMNGHSENASIDDALAGIVIPFNIYSASAVKAARRYVTLVAEQLSQAQANDRIEALQQLRTLLNPDEADYQVHIGSIDRCYEDDFRPILYFTSVVYLYMIFETYVLRHAAEIHPHHNGIKKVLNANSKGGLVKEAQKYFEDHVGFKFFSEEQWTQLREIAHVRNCIVHDAGIPRDSIKNRDSIYELEKRIWQDQPVGLQIEWYQKRDLGCPMILKQRFLEYCLSVLEDLFHALGNAAEAKFRK
jgi:hypothetical protein